MKSLELRSARYREQAEKVEDLRAFTEHCREKLESFHEEWVYMRY